MAIRGQQKGAERGTRAETRCSKPCGDIAQSRPHHHRGVVGKIEAEKRPAGLRVLPRCGSGKRLSLMCRWRCVKPVNGACPRTSVAGTCGPVRCAVRCAVRSVGRHHISMRSKLLSYARFDRRGPGPLADPTAERGYGGRYSFWNPRLSPASPHTTVILTSVIDPKG